MEYKTAIPTYAEAMTEQMTENKNDFIILIEEIKINQIKERLTHLTKLIEK